MANFDLYISKIEENIDDYKRYREKCLDDIEYSYNVLNNIDTSWIDHNTDTFLNKLSKDKEEIKRYFSYLDKLYNQIEIFKDNIVSVINRYGYNGRINSLSFSNDRYSTCINYIDNSIYYINQSINKILSIVYPADFSKLDLVNEILRKLYSLNDNLYNCENDISNFSNSIFNEISNSRMSVSRIETFNPNLSISSYNWSNVEIDSKLSKYDVDEETEKASTKKLNDQDDITISGLGENIFNHNAEDDSIDETRKTVVEGLHDDFNEEYAMSSFIDENAQEGPSGLGNNVDLKNASSNETNEGMLDMINGLNDNIKMGKDKKDNLDIDLQEEIAGLSNNVEEQKANSADFDIKEQELQLNKIDEYDKRENSLELSKHFDSDGNLSVNVFDNNSKTLDMESNSSYNIGDGIKSVGDITGTKVNVDSTNNYDLSSNISKMNELDLNNNR